MPDVVILDCISSDVLRSCLASPWCIFPVCKSCTNGRKLSADIVTAEPDSVMSVVEWEATLGGQLAVGAGALFVIFCTLVRPNDPTVNAQQTRYNAVKCLYL